MFFVLMRRKSLDSKITQATRAGYELGKADKDRGIILKGVVNYQVAEILRKN